MFSFSATNVERISGLGEDSVSVSSRTPTGGDQLGGHGPWGPQEPGKDALWGYVQGLEGGELRPRPPPTPGPMVCPAPVLMSQGCLSAERVTISSKGRGWAGVSDLCGAQVWLASPHQCEAGQSRSKASLAAEVGVRRYDVEWEGCQYT